jgi:hypothetical protein
MDNKTVPEQTDDDRISELSIEDKSHKAAIQPLGLTCSYARDWKTRDAFRELYQNW